MKFCPKFRYFAYNSKNNAGRQIWSSDLVSGGQNTVCKREKVTLGLFIPDIDINALDGYNLGYDRYAYLFFRVSIYEMWWNFTLLLLASTICRVLYLLPLCLSFHFSFLLIHHAKDII